MKKVFLVLIILFSYSCRNAEEKFVSEFPDSTKHRIEFLEKDFYIPSHYKKASLGGVFQKKLQDRNSTNPLHRNKQRYQQLLESSADFEYFIDESNPANSITFVLGEYVLLNKKNMYSFAEILRKQNPNRDLLEKKFYNLSYADVVKVKFRNKAEIFTTQYLISRGSKTISMIVVNSENEDYDHLIKNFSI